MKTTYKAHRGKVYHVVHETRTGNARMTCHTICGQFFEHGTRSERSATCPNCLLLDNPYHLASEMRTALRKIHEGFPLSYWGTIREALCNRDLINEKLGLTRRGAVLAEDWDSTPVPLPDQLGILHARRPLLFAPLCASGGLVADASVMTISRYEKLRRVQEDRPVVPTCIECAGMRITT